MDQIPSDVLSQFGILEDRVQCGQQGGGKMRFEDGEVGDMVGGGRQAGRNSGNCFLAHLVSGAMVETAWQKSC